MAVRCAAVILGTNIPLVTLLTSSMALLLGAEPSVLIPRLWANETVAIRKAKIKAIKCFINLVLLKN